MTEDRVRVLVRLSRPQSDGSWETREAEHETVRPSGVTVEEAVKLELEVLDRALRNTIPSASQPEKAKPSLDPGELDRLEWKLYHPPHRAGWTFADKAPRTLLESLETGPLTLGDFSYKFSGPTEQPRLSRRAQPF